ncbi:type II toxin-antitoxin system VapC family toxin [Affinirhizobium pseudoryzae]|uniref:type II toxin-antitoxin system VapC family toxin n=1 Tax=Allorhizobium pseudoryzae TaxID=379684 RepID=UPI0013ED0310|nr:type II toxin-antitoxin system VapC family toxin [Allorhizobium pseudoryzae]
MVIDSSAITAILANEADAESLERRLLADPVRLISAANFLELAIVIEAKFGDAGAKELNTWFELAAVNIVPVDAALADVARQAWRRFGKGRHAAALNFGDCFSYAMAKAHNQPLLFKGNDFSQTDIPAA